MKKIVNSVGQLFSILLFGMLLILACQQEQNDVVSKNDLSKEINDTIPVVSIEEAKAFFNTNFNSSTTRENGHAHSIEGRLQNKIPKWTKAGYKKISFGEAVIVPVEFEGLSLVVNKKTRAYVPYNQLNYLMMYKDNKKSMTTEWVTLLPDSAWLYGDRHIYTGDILVRNWEGKYIKMYKYNEDGTSEAFNISNSPESVAKNGRTNLTTYTRCMNMRSDETCTCSDKNNCDYCEICAPYVCYTITLITEPVTPTGGSEGSGGSTSTGSGNGGGGAGGSGNYNPTCNPNIAPGTPVSPNQALPCGTTYTPVTVLDIDGLAGPNYNTFEEFAGDTYYQPFFEELNDAELQFLKQHLNLVWSGARNFNEAINYGNTRFHNAQDDNTNANAYKHLLWTGTNYLSWDLGNNTNYAQTFADLHELGPGSINQHEMDNVNNRAAINEAKILPINKRNRDGMSEAALQLMIKSDTPCRRLQGGAANGALIKTDGSGRK